MLPLVVKVIQKEMQEDSDTQKGNGANEQHAD